MLKKSPAALRPVEISRGVRRRSRAPLLSAVRKKAPEKKLNPKRQYLRYCVYAGLFIVAIGTAAGIFIGLQKVESKKGTSDVPAVDMERPRNLTSGLLYAYTTMTTIGYGNVATKTTEGKIVTMVYAMTAFPFFMSYVNYLAKLFQLCLLLVYERLRRYSGGGKHFLLTRDNSEDGRVFAFNLLVFAVYLFSVSGLYSILQAWPYWQSIYFAYQSMSVIGFGDVIVNLRDPAFIELHLIITTVGIVLLGVCFFAVRDFWANVADRIALRFCPDPPLSPGESVRPTGDDDDDDTIRALGQAETGDEGKASPPKAAKTPLPKTAKADNRGKKTMAKMTKTTKTTVTRT